MLARYFFCFKIFIIYCFIFVKNVNQFQYFSLYRYASFHSSFLGGNNGLRGYRNERFSSKNSLYDSSNLKLKVTSFKTGLIPIDFGFYGGFDVGRVWIENDPSRKWHTSQGGGIWFGGLSTLSLQAAYFNSNEGNIVFVGFNFKY